MNRNLIPNQWTEELELKHTPFWPDGCEHGTDAYVCSFECVELHQDKVFRRKVDLYVFDHKYHGTEVCLRDGPKAEQYWSPGSLMDFLSRQARLPHYELGQRILREFGRCDWQPRKDRP